MHLHFLLPGFLPPLQKIGPDLLQGLKLPALEKLVARGNLLPRPSATAESWLLSRFGFSTDTLPSAPYCLLAEGVPPGEERWFHADPIHLGLQRSGMFVADASQFDLQAEEADDLVSALNAHFAADGIEFIAPHPHRWYGKSAHPAPANRALPEVRGGPAEHAPSGPWSRIASEIQMLLHAHPVNSAREDRGALPINSLWLWGGGQLAAPAVHPFDHVLADNLLARGLHTAAGGQALPFDAPLPAAGETLVVDESLRVPAAYNDFPAWRDALARIETRCFAPLQHALEQGKIATLELHLPEGGRCLSLRRHDLLKIWRRRPLTSLFA